MDMNSNKENRHYELDIQNQLDLGSHDVIYALRTAHQHQSQLLFLADQKANILMGILAVILAIIFTKADFLSAVGEWLLIPVACFVLLEVAALLLALLVVMPKTVGRMKPLLIEDIPNPFFFGFFTKFREEDYLRYLACNLDTDQQARHLLAKDLYQVGQVLRKKYFLLKYTYILAVSGVVLLAFSTIFYWTAAV